MTRGIRNLRLPKLSCHESRAGSASAKTSPGVSQPGRQPISLFNFSKALIEKLPPAAFKKKEAISGSSNTALLRVGTNPTKKKESIGMRGALKAYRRIREADGQQESAYKVCLIQEGMGNRNDAHFYTAETLQKAAPLFEGKKCFANHPSALDEQVQPERQVQAIIGYFQNVKYEEDDTGRGRLVAELVIFNGDQYDWVRQLIESSIEFAKKFPDRNLVGLSINAYGDATAANSEDIINDPKISDAAKEKVKAALAAGIKEVKIVTELTDANSCDLVTEAGAGGKVLGAA